MLCSFYCNQIVEYTPGKICHFTLDYPWCCLGAQAIRRSPTTSGVPRSSLVTPYGFRGGQNGVWIGFSLGFPRFSLPQISFHHFSAFISSVSFYFISSVLWWCDRPWSAGILDIHWPSMQGLHRIWSLDPVLCRTWVDDIVIYYPWWCHIILKLKRHTWNVQKIKKKQLRSMPHWTILAEFFRGQGQWLSSWLQ